MESKTFLGQVQKYKKIGEGSFSEVYLAEYLEESFAYKEFLCSSESIKKIKCNIEKLTGISEKGIILPHKLVYARKDDDVFRGYLMDYLSDYSELYGLKKLSYEKKLDILRKVRALLDTFHNKYKMLHGDITPWNILYNESNDECKLIDFDLSIDLIKLDSVDKSILSDFALYYSEYFDIDKDLDMFLFNLTTYSVINNIEFFDALWYIVEDNVGLIENKHAIDILKGYKEIKNSKILKKEYIIDYL